MWTDAALWIAGSVTDRSFTAAAVAGLAGVGAYKVVTSLIKLVS